VKVLARPGVVVGLSLWAIAAVVWFLQPAAPPHAVARAVPVPAATSNPYWAGYIATGLAPYTAIRASWTVPAVSCQGAAVADSTAYAWIGEGGYLQGLASPLIQAGTASSCLAGVPQYDAFYEWYPGIYATDFPIVVRPGDSLTIRIEEAQPDYWLLSVLDSATGQRSTTATFYHTDTGSADFVVERPALCASTCDQVPLARFGAITFSQIQTRDARGVTHEGVQGAMPIALADPATENVLALPGRAAKGTLAVLWRRDY